MRLNHSSLVACLVIYCSSAGVAQAAPSWVVTDTIELGRYLHAYEAKLGALNDYVLRSTISSYHNTTDAMPAEVERTTLWKMGDRMRSEAFGVITVQDNTLRVTVDAEERMIMLSVPEGSLSMADAGTRTIMFLAAQQVRKTTDPLGVRFQLTFPKAATYSTLELVFDKQGWLRSMTTCWARPIIVEPGNPLSDQVLPKVRVDLTEPGPIGQKVELDIAKLVDRKAAQLRGVGAYADFEVYDTRTP